MRIVLANWQWRDDVDGVRWEAPVGTVQSIDLRTLPQMAATVIPGGFGLFVLGDAAPVPAGAIELGRDFIAPIAGPARRNIESALGLQRDTVFGVDIKSALWSVLTENSDPSGQSAVRPKLPSRDGKFYLTLLGKKTGMGSFDKLRHNWVKASLRHDYAAEITRTGSSVRLLEWMSRKYGYSKQELSVPSGAATLSESFNTADSDTLGPDQTWTEVSGDFDVVGNRASVEATPTVIAGARVESDLAGADHFAQAAASLLDITNTRVGTAVRFASAATTYYSGAVFSTGGNINFRINKVIAGTLTQLAISANEAYALANLRTEVVNDDLEVFYDTSDPPTTSKLTVANDTSITSGTRVGLYGRATGAGRARVDSWNAGDIGAPAAAAIRRNMLSMGIGR